MEESLGRIEHCMQQLTADEVWQKPNPALSSMGNLLLHLNGNMTQYILAGLGGIEDKRIRGEEFTARPALGVEQLKQMIRDTIVSCCHVLHELNDDDLQTNYQVQGFKLSGIGIILHVVEHLSYHTGQITFWTKLLKNMDLGYYSGIDLNKRNEH